MKIYQTNWTFYGMNSLRKKELNSIINVSRYYLADIAADEFEYFEILSFSDASKKTYGTVVYHIEELKT